MNVSKQKRNGRYKAARLIYRFIKRLGYDGWNNDDKKRGRLAASLLLRCVTGLGSSTAYRTLNKVMSDESNT